jgi:hypothetical protein
MKLVTTLFVIYCLLFVTMGCKSQNVDGQPGLISEFGEWKCFSTLWVSASAAEKRISVKHLESHGSTVNTADDWTTGKGWFVFAETVERVWIYNGKDLRLLLITPSIGSKIYRCNYPCVEPVAVRQQIEEATRLKNP